jgi:predicted HAD superfamily phosphohydrolase
MKISLNDPAQLLSHIMLEGDKEFIDKLIETDVWKNEHVVIATVQFNGVEIPAESAEKTLHRLYADIEKQIEEKYSDINAEVERRVRFNMKKLLDRIDEVCEAEFEVYNWRSN